MHSLVNNIIINLTNNSGYRWFQADNVYVKGYAFINNHLYQEEEFANYIASLVKEKLIDKLKEIEGFYSIVAIYDSLVFAAVDHVRSFPLFYYNKDGTFYLCDTLDETNICDFKLDNDSEKQLWGAMYLLGNKTLFKNVYGLQAGNYLVKHKASEPQIVRYWCFNYAKHQIDDFSEAVELIEDTYKKSFERLIKYLNGRTAVVPLSGGHDSRMIVYFLKKSGYKNIITFSYGNPSMKDSKISKMVAKVLNVPYYYIPYTRKNLRKAIKKDLKKYMFFASNGVSVPDMQTWYAIRWLKENRIINEECIVCPGYGGVLPGHYVSEPFVQNKTISGKELFQKLQNEFFASLSRKHPNYYTQFCKEFKTEYPLVENSNIPAKQAAELFEQIIFLEDQTKGIQNTNRVFEYYSLKWVTPFFEKAQFAAWTNIDNKLRIANKAYIEFERRLYEGEIKSIPFTGSKEMGFEKEHVRKHRNIFQKIFEGLKICAFPTKHHYMTVSLPIYKFWYYTMIERQSRVGHFYEKQYLKNIKRLIDEHDYF